MPVLSNRKQVLHGTTSLLFKQKLTAYQEKNLSTDGEEIRVKRLRANYLRGVGLEQLVKHCSDSREIIATLKGIYENRECVEDELVEFLGMRPQKGEGAARNSCYPMGQVGEEREVPRKRDSPESVSRSSRTT